MTSIQRKWGGLCLAWEARVQLWAAGSGATGPIQVIKVYLAEFCSCQYLSQCSRNIRKS